MLIQFMVKNFLSFKEEALLDMTAINAYKEHEYNLIDNGTKEKFLRVAAIYGANASGKSNLYLAMEYFQSIIQESFNNVEDNEQTAIEQYYYPFVFTHDKKNTEFQVIMVIGEFEYKYGFEYNEKCIVSEWMYRKNIKTNRTSTILERTCEETKVGGSVKRECEIYKDQIPGETLALSFFNKLKLKTDIFKEMYGGIMNISVVPTILDEDSESIRKFLPRVIDVEKSKLLEFLAAIDTGITDLYYQKLERENAFFTIHIGEGGEKYHLPLFYESEGTIRSIIIYIYARAAILGNSTLVVDELNIKLHPLLLKFIIDLFYVNNSQAQLIYTTHDTMLLDKRFFRRDQIWFVQKDEFGHSMLTALSDYKVRSDASFEKDYLAGVYGGIPSIKEFTMKEDQ